MTMPITVTDRIRAFNLVEVKHFHWICPSPSCGKHVRTPRRAGVAALECLIEDHEARYHYIMPVMPFMVTSNPTGVGWRLTY